MNEFFDDAFAIFARQQCSDLIGALAEAGDAVAEVVGAAGGALVSSTPDGSDTRSDPDAIRATIEVDGEYLGELVLHAPNERLRPLLSALAEQIAERFMSERDLDRMTDRVSQSYDEINLLYRFNRLLKPTEGYETTAQKLLEETADLLEERTLIIYRPADDHFAYRGQVEQEPDSAIAWVTQHPESLMPTLEAYRRRVKPERNPSVDRLAGRLTTPAGAVHYMLNPIRIQLEMSGFVGLFCHPEAMPLETGEVRLLECLAEELSNAGTTRQLYQELRDMLFATVKSLVAAIDAKDEYTRGHSERVYLYSMKLAERLGLDEEEMRTLSWAALLHDIGKIAISSDILNKPSKLTDEEYLIIKTHPVRGVKVLEPIPQLRHILPTIRHHHERYDGRGYPDGIAGEEIPVLARILAVADTYDAMYSTRAYRPAQTKEFAIGQIREGAGTQFDPEMAEIFLEMILSGALENTAAPDDQAAAA